MAHTYKPNINQAALPTVKRKMLLTTCAACAAPLAHDAPRCVRCKTGYCNATCQHDHWRRGHKQICKKIHRGGNAEQYHADNKYKEAVAEAVEACVEDTKGQKCYICLEAAHPRTGEGLVRGCACGDRDGVASPELGVAHVSCLAEQAKILVAEAVENKLGAKALEGGWARWRTCDLCKQDYHGVVACALGWACWKTYLGREERDPTLGAAMTDLANGLSAANYYGEALNIELSVLAVHQRMGSPDGVIASYQGNIACSYNNLKCHDKALELRRVIYTKHLSLYGPNHIITFMRIS